MNNSEQTLHRMVSVLENNIKHVLNAITTPWYWLLNHLPYEGMIH